MKLGSFNKAIEKGVYAKLELLILIPSEILIVLDKITDGL